MNTENKKPRVIFPFVEAGMGHIMPMTAIADAFEEKHGDRAEVVRTKIFQDTHNPDLEWIESELVNEVKLHNRHKYKGVTQRIGMAVAGTRLSMWYVMKKRYGRGFDAAVKYIESLDASLIFSTHFATHYYACEARKKGLTRAQIIGYCPDPVIGKQWDTRVDIAAVSSESGRKKAVLSGRYARDQVINIPFLIRREVRDYDKGRAHYRRELGLPEDRFTLLLADGAYGEGRLRATVYELLKSPKKLTVVAVCGKNEKLYRELSALVPPENIFLKVYGFTDKTLMLAAACDLFMGKAGASNLAEPVYFGAPAIVTFTATFIEKWICAHHVKNGCAVKITNVKKAVKTAIKWSESPDAMRPYIEACGRQKSCDGPEILADELWRRLELARRGEVGFRKNMRRGNIFKRFFVRRRAAWHNANS